MKLARFTLITTLLLLTLTFQAKPGTNLFIENSGQWNPEISYASQLANSNIIITPQGIYYDFKKHNSGEVIQLKFADALNYKIRGQEKAQAKYNFFYGNNPEKWIADVNTYNSVKLSNVYPGIDALVYIDKGMPRYDFIVYPGANPNKIRLIVEGAQNLSLQNNEIIINGKLGKYKQSGLFAYQTIDGNKVKVNCVFEIKNNTIKFNIGKYNKNLPLVIDPVIFADYIGGQNEDGINAVKAADGGYIITAGYSDSPDFKTTPGAYDTIPRGEMDIIVKKFRIIHSTRELVFATYIGGGLNDVANDLALDRDGVIYLTGKTNSSDFPIINPFISQFSGDYDAFFIRLNPEGDDLLNSSYLGGSSEDVGTGIAINPQNSSVAICGYTNSRNFPIYGSADQGTLGGLYDAFITKLRTSHTSIEFSTYWGGTNNDRALAIAQDNSFLYVGGETDGNFPIKPSRIWHGNVVDKPLDGIYNGKYDGFALKMDQTGSGVEFSTYFGGKEDDRVTAVAYFRDGSMLIAGETRKESGEATFMITDNAFQKKNKGGLDGFIAHLGKIKIKQPFNQKYQELIFSTFFGGSSDDSVRGMSYDNDFASLYIVGNTRSSNFPIKGDDVVSDIKGKFDAYVAKFSNLGSDLIWSTLMGGSLEDIATSCAIDSLNNVIIAGITESNDFIPENQNFQGEYAGGATDGFVSKFQIGTLEIAYPIANDQVCSGSHLDIKYNITGFDPNEPFSIDYQLSPDSAWVNLTTNATGGQYRWNIPVFDNPLDSVRIRITHVSGICDTSGYFQIMTPARIIEQTYYPESREVCEGDTILIYTEVQGSNLGFQWYLNNQKLPDQTSQDLFIDNATLANSGKYKLVVIGQCKPNATSDEIEFTVKPKTKITLQPEDKIAVKGENVQFEVEADGVNLTYEWQRNNQKILGANESTYTIENVQKSNEGNYRCIVSGECSNDTSRSAILRVEDPSDVTSDAANQFEIKAFTNSTNDITVSVQSYSLSNITLNLIDIFGRPVQKIFDGQISGSREFTVNKSSISSGIYFLNATNGPENKTIKLIITK